MAEFTLPLKSPFSPQPKAKEESTGVTAETAQFKVQEKAPELTESLGTP